MTNAEASAAMQAILDSYPESERAQAAITMLQDAFEDYAVLVGREEASRLLRSYAEAIERGDFHV
jgi:hypothetical protein